MLFTTHTIVGAAVGVATKNPVLGFVASFFIHHALDSLPHFDQGSFHIKTSGPRYLGNNEIVDKFSFTKKDWVMLVADFAIGGTTILFLLYSFPLLWSSLLIGIIGGLMPDIIDSSPLWSKRLRAKYKINFHYHRFHIFFHWTATKNELILGSATQISVITLSLLYLYL